MSVKTLKNSFFDPEGLTTSTERRAERRKKIKSMGEFGTGNSFFNFGYDYFDNINCLNGYGGYDGDERYKSQVKLLCKYYQLEKKSRILDYGCAKGSVVYSFLSSGYTNAFGIDVSHYAVEQAPAALREKLYVFDGQASSLPFNEPFDLVVSKDVLPHLNIKQLHELFIALKKLKCKNYYFEIQCVASTKDLFLLALWDETHKTCMTETSWTELLNEYFGEELSVYFKRIV